MKESQRKQITELFEELERADPQASTEYLMQMTCDHAFQRYKMRLDAGDVCDTLLAGEDSVFSEDIRGDRK